MEKEMMLALICLGFFAMVVLTVYFIMKFRAVRPPRVPDLVLPPKRKSDWQKPGIVVLGIGVGVLITGVLHVNSSVINDAINVGIVIACAGISMVVANVLDKDKSIEE